MEIKEPVETLVFLVTKVLKVLKEPLVKQVLKEPKELKVLPVS